MYPYSSVNTYARQFPTRFISGEGCRLMASDGRAYLDFVAGCGSLAYGHADPTIRRAMVAYLEGCGPLQAMDMQTEALVDFLDALTAFILRPRGLDHRVMLCGPTGADAVEAAVKVARAATNRPRIVAFTGAYHGVTAGALALTASPFHRAAGAPDLGMFVSRALYPSGPFGERPDALRDIDWSDVAGVVVEAVQGEGGVYSASSEFLRGLRRECDRRGALLILDDVQAGCGRTGPFFPWESAGIVPDVVCLSKAIGAGSPLSLCLVRPAFDTLKPGQHCGTFRGNQLALVAGEAALRRYWSNQDLERAVASRARLADAHLAQHLPDGASLRVRGLMIGVDLRYPGAGVSAARRCFERGLLVESCGPNGEVVKLLPPLTIEEADLLAGLDILTSVLPLDVGEAQS